MQKQQRKLQSQLNCLDSPLADIVANLTSAYVHDIGPATRRNIDKLVAMLEEIYDFGGLLHAAAEDFIGYPQCTALRDKTPRQTIERMVALWAFVLRSKNNIMFTIVARNSTGEHLAITPLQYNSGKWTGVNSLLYEWAGAGEVICNASHTVTEQYVSATFKILQTVLGLLNKEGPTRYIGLKNTAKRLKTNNNNIEAETEAKQPDSNITEQIIYVNKPNYIRAQTNAPHEPSGQTRSPHDRAGHYRTLRDGRKVRVKPCKIHGGYPEGTIRRLKKVKLAASLEETSP
jgi:hypothetical protein